MAQKIIQIIVTKESKSEWKTTHKIEGIPLILAGMILIDVGRDILASLAHLSDHHHHREEGQQADGS